MAVEQNQIGVFRDSNWSHCVGGHDSSLTLFTFATGDASQIVGGFLRFACGSEDRAVIAALGLQP